MSIADFLASLDRQPWMSQGLCCQVDGDTFFPERGQRNRAEDAKRVCRTCPVRDECTAYAIAHDERFGIWGATTPHARRKARHTQTG